MKRGIAVIVAAVLALLGLSPAAFAAVFQPSPPTITMVGSPDQTVPAHPQLFQLSPKPGETGFTVLSYDDQVAGDTNADPATFSTGSTSAAGQGGIYTGDGSYTQYVRARMNVTLSDGIPYTTDWSLWVKVQPGPSTGPAPGPTPAPACPPVWFIGVAGSGEKGKAGGYGNTIADVKQQIEKAIPGTDSVAVDYPAIPVNPGDPKYGVNYLNSMAAGRQKLGSILQVAFSSKCTKTQIIIAGYSQGAQVAADTFQNLSKSHRARVILLLFGEPRFNPIQFRIDKGDYKLLFGSFPGPRIIQSDSASRVRSYCTKGDPVCNFSSGNLTLCLPGDLSCPHFLYIQRGWTKQAAAWAVTQVRSAS